ncbi:hypothetical protein FDC62_11325 [Clostridium botulinum]|uniref:hypothetical protein n=1 Tax=Clostridium botulinum TaxID=1491 RepID=UPI00099462F9|nr:hypothetical protein [Clostridium botulinum]NFO98773.1 hypothetical protein [Clostridium botulinum]OOV52311.1 hypothetical protein B1A66_04685 [Clostridium botulinum D/C]OOV54079.1 hypothetical protein B0673_11490 [Clostridium botulinum D/C]OOV58079.1 hypothetical protein B1A67_03525 [Clostridium botulinum D/C]
MSSYGFKEEDFYCHKCGAEGKSVHPDYFQKDHGVEMSIFCEECGYNRVVDFATNEEIMNED